MCGKMPSMHRIVVDALEGSHAPAELAAGPAGASLVGVMACVVGSAAVVCEAATGRTGRSTAPPAGR